MSKYYVILLAALYLMPGSIAQANENLMPGVKTNEQINNQQLNSERILVLYDNPMEEHTIVSVIEVRGYDVKNEKQRNTAIRELKKQAAKIKAHAIIIQNPTKNTSEHAGVAKDGYLSAKAIRYKHFYY